MNYYYHLKCYLEGQPIFAIYVNVVMVTTVYLEIGCQPYAIQWSSWSQKFCFFKIWQLGSALDLVDSLSSHACMTYNQYP